MQGLNRLTLPALACGLALGAAQPLLAQDQGSGAMLSGGNWTFSATLGGAYGPVYQGSNVTKAGPLLDFSAQFKDGLFFIGLAGIGYTPLNSDQGSLSIALTYGGGRDVKDDRKNLTGMGDIKSEALLVLSGSYLVGPLALGAEVTAGDTYGKTADLSIGGQVPLGERLTLSGGLTASWMDGDHARTYFGVTAAQSARSGKRAYTAGGGLSSAGVSVSLDYALSDATTISFGVDYSELQNSAAKSPLSVEDGQLFAVFSVSTNF